MKQQGLRIHAGRALQALLWLALVWWHGLTTCWVCSRRTNFLLSFIHKECGLRALKSFHSMNHSVVQGNVLPVNRNVHVEGDWEVGLHKRSVAKTCPWQKRPDKPLLTAKLKKGSGIKGLREIKSHICDLIKVVACQ